jgi:hypothetical protein
MSQPSTQAFCTRGESIIYVTNIVFGEGKPVFGMAFQRASVTIAHIASAVASWAHDDDGDLAVVRFAGWTDLQNLGQSSKRSTNFDPFGRQACLANSYLERYQCPNQLSWPIGSAREPDFGNASSVISGTDDAISPCSGKGEPTGGPRCWDESSLHRSDVCLPSLTFGGRTTQRSTANCHQTNHVISTQTPMSNSTIFLERADGSAKNTIFHLPYEEHSFPH